MNVRSLRKSSAARLNPERSGADGLPVKKNSALYCPGGNLEPSRKSKSLLSVATQAGVRRQYGGSAASRDGFHDVGNRLKTVVTRRFKRPASAHGDSTTQNDRDRISIHIPPRWRPAQSSNATRDRRLFASQRMRDCRARAVMTSHLRDRSRSIESVRNRVRASLAR